MTRRKDQDRPMSDYEAYTLILMHELDIVKKGERLHTVRRVAFSLGRSGDYEWLDLIINTINHEEVFRGEEQFFIAVAKRAFKAGYESRFGKQP